MQSLRFVSLVAKVKVTVPLSRLKLLFELVTSSRRYTRSKTISYSLCAMVISSLELKEVGRSWKLEHKPYFDEVCSRLYVLTTEIGNLKYYVGLLNIS